MGAVEEYLIRRGDGLVIQPLGRSSGQLFHFVFVAERRLSLAQPPKAGITCRLQLSSSRQRRLIPQPSLTRLKSKRSFDPGLRRPA